MKPTSFLISFILFSIFTSSLFCSAAEAPEPVLDIAGKDLRAGIYYYILLVIHDGGGGLILASAGNDTCPHMVMQDYYEDEPGYLLTFTLVNPKKGVIRISTDLNVKFSPTATSCDQSTVWKLDDYDYSSEQYFISTCGVEGNPRMETISNWFKIEKYGSGYKFVYCPTVCEFCKVICKDVGIFIRNRRLALSDAPLMVMFKKV